VDAAIHPDGSISESATPELRRLTHQAHSLKQQMRHQVDQILHSRRYEDILQEQYFAQREGRYVIPVKTDMRGRVPGIVHDVSASGATVFLEPRELVELNNSIKVADLEIEREVRRILRELSALVAAQSEVVLAGLDALAVLDGISARALFGRQPRRILLGSTMKGAYGCCVPGIPCSCCRKGKWWPTIFSWMSRSTCSSSPAPIRAARP
jgi:DNA mismatch repair protein MutS2